MDIAEIRKLIRVMRDHGILELELQDRRGKIRLVRDNGGRAESALRGPVANENAGRGEVIVAAPMVGTFHRGPGPDAPPFVEVGAPVQPGPAPCVLRPLPAPAGKVGMRASPPVRASPRRLALTAIIAGSVLIRVLYFLQLSSGPCVWQHLWPESDMFFFDRWARTIAAGDWLTDRALHPHVGWHREIADTYFAEHPDAAEAIAREQPAKQPWEALWDHWYADKCFHQEPLYPYLLAVTYRALGPDVRWVFGWQLAIGVLTNVLVYLVARRHFGDAVAGLAGAAAVLCGPMLLYEMVLTRESLLAFAGMALVFLIERAMVRPAWRSWLAVGAAFGLAVLPKTTFLLFFLGVP